MTTEIRSATPHIHTSSIPMTDSRIRSATSQVGRFSLHFLEMVVAMMVGMPIFSLVRNLIPASSILSTAFKSGTIAYGINMTVFMTLPMVAWMILRGHGWRHSVEMALAMVAPVALTTVLSLLGAAVYLPWLGNASHFGMFLGMLIVMLYHRDHYTGKTSHSAHTAHGEIS